MITGVRHFVKTYMWWLLLIGEQFSLQCIWSTSDPSGVGSSEHSSAIKG